MKSKICFKCNIEQPIDNFYVHKGMSDGRLNKCKPCTRKDSANNKTVSRICVECGKNFMANPNEIKRRGGGAKTCSRTCYFAYQPKMLEVKFNGKRSYYALHHWIRRKRGEPVKCDFCGALATDRRIEWSNISGQYKEEITDWQPLCVPCHRRYDDAGNKAWITRRKNILLNEKAE